MIYLYLVIIIILFLTIKYLLKKKPHRFWNNQPVSNNQSNEGIITINLPNPIEINYHTQIIKSSPIDNSFRIFITDFLNKYYIKSYIFNINNISWYLSYPHLKKNNVLNLKYKNNIIGNIISKPYALNINNKTIFTHYVDMLAVHKEYRNNNYAPILISHTVKESSDKDFRTFIFKKEDTSLPFNYICKCKYYILNIPDNILNNNPTGIYSVGRTQPNDYEYIRKLYQNESIKYKCYPIFDKNQFEYIFSSYDNAYESLIIHENGVKKGIVTYVINNVNDKNTKIAEIVLLLCEDIDYVDMIKSLIEYCNKENVYNLLCVNIAKNRIFIDRMNFYSGMDVYFQMYNYHIKNRLNTNDMLFNFI
mgnify:CR=1 FL=1